MVLIWYFINTVQNQLFLSLHNTFILRLAEEIMDILDSEYEYAPENELHQDCHTLESENDYYEVRDFIDRLLFKTYLFYPNTGYKLREMETELIDEADENLIMYLREMRDELLHKSHTSLLALTGNNGEPIAFFKPGEIDDFVDEFYLQYQKDIGISKKESAKADKRAKKAGLLGGRQPAEKNIFENDFEVATCFFNPKGGLEFVMDASSAFPLPYNPYFDEFKSEEDIMHVLIDPSISREMAEYCITLVQDKLDFFKKGKGRFLKDDMDFLLRFWKRENYFTKPQISLTGRSFQ